MFGNIVTTPQVGCGADHVRDLRLELLGTDEYCVYTPDGYIIVSSTRPAPRNSDDSSELTVSDETCF